MSPRQFNKHQRGYGNNFVLPQAHSDRTVIKDMLEKREKVSSNPAVVKAYMSDIDDQQPLRMPMKQGSVEDSICETNEEHFSQKDMTMSVNNDAEPFASQNRSFEQTHSTISTNKRLPQGHNGAVTQGTTFTSRATIDAW